MQLVRRCAAVFVASALGLLGSRHAGAAGGGTFGAPPRPPEPLEPGSFDAQRKPPPIPVSFLPHDGGWIQFQYPPSARDRVAPLIAQADDLRAELAEDLGQTPLDGIEVRVARGPEEMATLAPQATPPPLQATSIAYPKIKLIVLSLGIAGAGEPLDLGEGFRRELARVGLIEAIAGRSLPSWFAEGFVREFAREGEWGRGWTLYRASISSRLKSADELDGMLQKGGSEAAVASAEATDLVEYLLKPTKRAQFASAIEHLRQGDDLGSAIGSGYGSTFSSIEHRWRSDLGRRMTLATVLSSIGIPGLMIVGWAIARGIRQRRALGIVGRLNRVRAASASERSRVHIVLSRRDERFEPPVVPEPEIPKVEHEGEWHTLH